MSPWLEKLSCMCNECRAYRRQERTKPEEHLFQAFPDFAAAAIAKADKPETLRDKFAMAALTGFCAHNGLNAVPNSNGACVSADFAYEIADAMMEARKK